MSTLSRFVADVDQDLQEAAESDFDLTADPRPLERLAESEATE